MSNMNVFGLLVPQEALLPIFTLGGLALILGARKLATKVMGFALAAAILPPFVEPIIAGLPGWMLVIVVIGLAFGVLRAILRFMFGSGATDNIIGHLVAVWILGLFQFRRLAFLGSVLLLTWVISYVFG